MRTNIFIKIIFYVLCRKLRNKNYHKYSDFINNKINIDFLKLIKFYVSSQIKLMILVINLFTNYFKKVKTNSKAKECKNNSD